MQIDYSSNLNFAARNKTIRFADDIARKVNQVYPRISGSKVQDLKYAPRNNNFIRKDVSHNSKLIRNLSQAIYTLRENAQHSFKIMSRWEDKIQILPKVISKNKYGNCAESAFLAELAARANGIENCCQARCITPNNRRYDHVVLYVRDKKPYIIDPWLGFADYVPKAIERYRKEFRHHFDFDYFKTEKMEFEKVNCYFRMSERDGEVFFSQKPKEVYQQLFPELIIAL